MQERLKRIRNELTARQARESLEEQTAEQSRIGQVEQLSAADAARIEGIKSDQRWRIMWSTANNPELAATLAELWNLFGEKEEVKEKKRWFKPQTYSLINSPLEMTINPSFSTTENQPVGSIEVTVPFPGRPLTILITWEQKTRESALIKEGYKEITWRMEGLDREAGLAIEILNFWETSRFINQQWVSGDYFKGRSFASVFYNLEDFLDYLAEAIIKEQPVYSRIIQEDSVNLHEN